MEAGLRISPEMWSTQLFGNVSKKSDMQSIIDKVRKNSLIRKWLKMLSQYK